MANNIGNMTLNQIGANAKQFGQQKIVNPSAQYLNQNIGVPQVMMGALPAAAGIISSIPNYNEAIEQGKNPIGTLPWGTLGGAGGGALLALLFNKLAGVPLSTSAALNGGLLGMGLGGTIDSIRNSW